MEKTIHIYVEGVADVRFISDYIRHIKNLSDDQPKIKAKKTEAKKTEDKDIKETETEFCYNDTKVTVHGMSNWTNLKRKGKDMKRDKGDGKALVIVDADTDKQDEGRFLTRKQAIEKIGLPKDGLFLFPNNKDDGDLETLLENIINERNNAIFDCWNKYENCLREFASPKIFGDSDKTLTIPNKKAKIYAYLEALLGETKKKEDGITEASRNYREKEHWNLDSDYLNPLKKFLLEHLS